MTSNMSAVVKLIPEYTGEGSVSEWVEKLELVCGLYGVQDIASVLPLRLSGGAFAVYQQLPDAKKKKADEIKKALVLAFAVDEYAAYEKFVSRRLGEGESPDVYLAELRLLADLFGGVPDQALACAFVAGLPDGVRQLLRAGAQMEKLKLAQILTRARAVLKDEGTTDRIEACAGMFSRAKVTVVQKEEGASEGMQACAGMATRGTRQDVKGQGCYNCGGPNHYARDCMVRRRTDKRSVKCYRCKKLGHIASSCPGNEGGEEV